MRSFEAPHSHRGADLPGHKFIVAIAELFRFRLLARGHAQDKVENLPALFLDGDAIQHVAAIYVHVLDHASVHVAVGGELDRRRRLAAIG